MVSAPKREYIDVVGSHRKKLLNVLREFRKVFLGQAKSEPSIGRQSIRWIGKRDSEGCGNYKKGTNIGRR